MIVANSSVATVRDLDGTTARLTKSDAAATEAPYGPDRQKRGRRTRRSIR
nr:hypothetical protein JVH1_7714 [Rhodococcus sp. JVH1]